MYMYVYIFRHIPDTYKVLWKCCFTPNLYYTSHGLQILARVCPLKGLLKLGWLGLALGVYDLTGLGRVPGDADALSLGTTLRNTGLEGRLGL